MRVSNVVNRNVCLILAISFFVGLIYCVYAVLYKEATWISLYSIATSTAIFIRLYLVYRKQVKNGNMYGKVNLFK